MSPISTISISETDKHFSSPRSSVKMFLLQMLLFVVFLNYSCLAHTSIIHKDDSTDLLELKLNKSLERVRNECKADNDLLKEVIRDQSSQIAYLFTTIAVMVNNTVEHNNGNRTLPDKVLSIGGGVTPTGDQT